MVTHLKHVAIASSDPDKAAKFFVDVLGWSIADRIDSKNALGYYVTAASLTLPFSISKIGLQLVWSFSRAILGCTIWAFSVMISKP